jgi:hypothetical protein
VSDDVTQDRPLRDRPLMPNVHGIAGEHHSEKRHKIRVTSDGGDFYATCDCGEWRTAAGYYSQADARQAGRVHIWRSNLEKGDVMPTASQTSASIHLIQTYQNKDGEDE